MNHSCQIIQHTANSAHTHTHTHTHTHSYILTQTLGPDSCVVSPQRKYFYKQTLTQPHTSALFSPVSPEMESWVLLNYKTQNFSSQVGERLSFPDSPSRGRQRREQRGQRRTNSCEVDVWRRLRTDESLSSHVSSLQLIILFLVIVTKIERWFIPSLNLSLVLSRRRCSFQPRKFLCQRFKEQLKLPVSI